MYQVTSFCPHYKNTCPLRLPRTEAVQLGIQCLTSLPPPSGVSHSLILSFRCPSLLPACSSQPAICLRARPGGYVQGPQL